MLVPVYEALAGDTLLLRGSPQGLLYRDSDTLYVIDPGQGGGRLKALVKAARDLSPGRLVAVITHFHSDHLEVLHRAGGRLSFDEVLAPEGDAAGVGDPRVRLSMTFGYPLEPGDEEALGLPFPAPPVGYTGTFKPGEPVGPLETIPLPGHTPGQAGVATPDGVFLAADALFGDRVLQRYLLPYHRDSCTALETLRGLDTGRYDYLVPGHGPVVRGGDAGPLIEANIRALEEAVARVEEAAAQGPMTLEEMLRAVAGDPSRAGTPGLLMLVEQSLRGILACLARRGRVKPLVTPRGLAWVKA